MKLAILYVAIIVTSVAAKGKKSGNNSSNKSAKRASKSSKTAPGTIPEGIKLKDFRESFEGRIVSTYMRYEEPVFMVTNRLECRFECKKPNDGKSCQQLDVTMKFRDETKTCKSNKVEWTKYDEGGNKNKAVFERKNLQDSKTARFTFYSPRPDNFMFLFVCFDKDSINDDVCTGNYVLDIINLEKIPNSMAYKEMSKSIEQDAGLSMESDNMHFLFLGEDCPTKEPKEPE